MVERPYFVITFKAGGTVKVPGTARAITTNTFEGLHTRYEFHPAPGAQLVMVDQSAIGAVVQYDPQTAADERVRHLEF